MGSCDVAIIGGGIVGLSTAFALAERFPHLAVAVFEAEDRLAAHQSGRNTGVIHSGIYCKPGTQIARHCAVGREALFRFCAEQGVPHERCGKLIVALRDEQLPGFHQLVHRARALGLNDLRLLDPAEIRDHEPHVAGKAGLYVGEAGLVDFAQVTRTLAVLVQRRGGRILTGARVHAVRRATRELLVETEHGPFSCGLLINCGGMFADRVARRCGVDPRLQIVPFQTVFHELRAEQPTPVRNLVYSVPPPGVAYLGLHFVRTLAGTVEVVRNPSFVHKREGYGPVNFALDDTCEMWRYSGFWRMVYRYGRASIRENRKLAGRGLLRAVAAALPSAGVQEVRWRRAGVHAQAIDPSGEPVHDLRVLEVERMIHVLNAPSPAATASLSIGRTLADAAARQLGRPQTIIAARPA